MKRVLSRRKLIAGVLPVLAAGPLATTLAGASETQEESGEPSNPHGDGHAQHAQIVPVRRTDELDQALYPPPARPHAPDEVREFELVSTDAELEIARDVRFPAWTYNGTVPGPIIRVTEGDAVRVRFRNEGGHGHSIHFHGVHRPTMDGSTAQVEPGQTFTYEFKARPAGVHLYHCHVMPLAMHVARGLYGAFIVDPPAGRPSAQELVMVLSGFDLDDDGRNELYAINGRPNLYANSPIWVRRSETLRIYLVNLTEYDPVNSFHLHAEFFRLYRTGTTSEPEHTDTVTLGQGERCMIEVDFEATGLYMFHAHQSSIAERGGMGWFNVADSEDQAARQAAGLGTTYAGNFAHCQPCLGTNAAKAYLKY